MNYWHLGHKPNAPWFIELIKICSVAHVMLYNKHINAILHALITNVSFTIAKRLLSMINMQVPVHTTSVCNVSSINLHWYSFSFTLVSIQVIIQQVFSSIELLCGSNMAKQFFAFFQLPVKWIITKYMITGIRHLNIDKFHLNTVSTETKSIKPHSLAD